MKEDKEDKRNYCPDCGSFVDEDGEAWSYCSYGEHKCETCGTCFCDQSC